MDNFNRGNIPIQEKLNLNKTQGASTPREVKRIQNVPYGLAKFIMYAVRCNRPDVAFAQNIKSIFQQNLRKPHWTAVKTILKYLRITKDMFLVYARNPEAELRVDCYCNVGFETDRDKIKSMTRYVFVWNGNAMGVRHYYRRYLLKVHRDDSQAYPFMNALPKGKLNQHAKSMGLRLARTISEVIMKHGDMALVFNIEFVPSIVEV
ncbi:hypothetical protein Tco_1479531 [Tanacetum coccineum]